MKISQFIYDALLNQVDSVFVKRIGSDESFSRHELKRDIDALLNRLHSERLDPKGNIVGIAMHASYEFIKCDLALLLHGGISLPVPLDFTDDQIQSLLNKGAYCFVENETVGLRLKTIFPNKTLVLPDGQIYHQGLEEVPFFTNSNDIIKIIHTSGTTSNPKGVLIRDEAVGILVKNLIDSIEHNHPLHYFSLVPMSLLIEQVLGIYIPLMTGGSITLLPKDIKEYGAYANSHLYIQLISKACPNFIYLPPQLIEALDSILSQDNHGHENIFKNTPPYIITGGAKVHAETLHRLEKKQVLVYEGYGMSENSSVISINRPSYRKVGTSGQLLPGVQAKIVDNELWIKSPTLCAGYYNLDATACPITADGFLKTGDLAYFDEEGYLVITGRKKNLIVLSNARNVSPEWIEGLFKESPCVREVIVFGDGMDYLSAVIVPTVNANHEHLQSDMNQCNEKLPLFARVTTFHIISATDHFQRDYYTVTQRPKREKIFNDFSNGSSVIANYVYANKSGA